MKERNWLGRAFFLLFTLLVGLAGGILAFYFFFNLSVENEALRYVQKVTERQVFVEESSMINAVASTQEGLLMVLSKDKLEGFKREGRCVDDGCRVWNGAILTNDGLVLVPGELPEGQLVAVDIENVVYDLEIVNKNVERKLNFGQLYREGDLALAAVDRMKFFNLKSVQLGNLGDLKVGQKVFMLSRDNLADAAKPIDGILNKLKNNLLLDTFKNSVGMFRMGTSLSNEGMIFNLNSQLIAVNINGIDGGGNDSDFINTQLKNYQNGKTSGVINFGFQARKMTMAELTALNIQRDAAYLVTDVLVDGLAAKMGLQNTDLIVGLDSKNLSNTTLEKLLQEKATGDKLQFRIIRAKQESVLETVL
jgi:hypothetical protein